MTNLPPGVTGNEPQIAGGSSWETWLENLKPGDPVWHIDGRKGVLWHLDEFDVIVVLSDGSRVAWSPEDCTQPEDSAFHRWVAEQPQGDESDHWEMT